MPRCWLHWLPVISLENVSKSYKTSTRPALDKVNVEVDKGEFVFIIGPSGSGKSTFMRLLLKEDNPTAGDIHVADFHVNRLSGRKVPKLRQRIGCVFQDFRLLQKKTVDRERRVRARGDRQAALVIERPFPRCWTWSAWPAKRTVCPPNSPAASSSASRSRGRS